jgi:hypothetical protein
MSRRSRSVRSRPSIQYAFFIGSNSVRGRSGCPVASPLMTQDIAKIAQCQPSDSRGRGAATRARVVPAIALGAGNAVPSLSHPQHSDGSVRYFTGLIQLNVLTLDHPAEGQLRP